MKNRLNRQIHGRIDNVDYLIWTSKNLNHDDSSQLYDSIFLDFTNYFRRQLRNSLSIILHEQIT